MNPDLLHCLLFVGTYTHTLPHVQARGEGIHTLKLDLMSGRLRRLGLIGGYRNPSYVKVTSDGRRLFCVEEVAQDEGAAICALDADPTSGDLRHRTRVSALGGWPCHLALSLDERLLFASNFDSGTMACFPIEGSEGLGLGRDLSGTDLPVASGCRQAHAHCVAPTTDGRHVLLTFAGFDQITRHRLGPKGVKTKPDRIAMLPQNSFPRHVLPAFAGEGFIVINEWASTIATYRFEQVGGTILSSVSTLPAGWTGANHAACLRLHPNGRVIYGSNRGHDSLFAATFEPTSGRLAPLGCWPCGGRVPRDFAIDPTGRFLVVGNQESHRLTVFAIAADGQLELTDESLDLLSPASLCFGKAVT